MNICGASGNNSGAAWAGAFVCITMNIGGAPALLETEAGGSGKGVRAAPFSGGKFVPVCTSTVGKGGKTVFVFGGDFGSSNRSGEGPTTGK